MGLRLATFNVENLLTRIDFSGFTNPGRADRALQLYDIANEQMFQRMEEARVMATTDDMRQLTALAIAEADADILCLQEVDNIAALNAFEGGYLYRMMGNGYRRKFLIEGNDSRGIDVAILLRERSSSGEPIDFVDIRSHAGVTYREFELFTPELAILGLKPDDRIFKRDCLEVDLKIGGRPITIYVVHLKSMQAPRELGDGRLASMPIRLAEAKAVRRIIEQRFANYGQANFAICGDMNDFQTYLSVTGSRRAGYQFAPVQAFPSALDVFSLDGFAENAVARRDAMDRWTHFHVAGPEERQLSQLDYIWLSPALAQANPAAVPEIIRGGQPFRTLFPPGQEIERFPRVGWDRPKASDHCPVVIELDLP